MIGDADVPGPADRARVFERRPATLPPGIAVIPEPDTPALDRGRHRRATCRCRAAGSSPTARSIGDAEPLPDVATPGAYPVSATVGRLGRLHFDSVAYASVVVSEAPTVSWVARSIVGVDGGTAGFTSAEGSEMLGRMGVTPASPRSTRRMTR